MKRKLIAVSVVGLMSLCVLAGCNDKNTAEVKPSVVKDLKYYENHEDEAMRVQDKCFEKNSDSDLCNMVSLAIVNDMAKKK
jgi:hypothetical protein